MTETTRGQLNKVVRSLRVITRSVQLSDRQSQTERHNAVYRYIEHSQKETREEEKKTGE